jgi:hypothetical protein
MAKQREGRVDYAGSVRADNTSGNFRWFKSGNLNGRLHHQLGRRLWDGYVPDVAELAV